MHTCARRLHFESRFCLTRRSLSSRIESDFNIDYAIYDVNGISLEPGPAFVEALPRRNIVAPAVSRAGDDGTLDFAVRDRSAHVLAVSFKAVQGALESEDGDVSGEDFERFYRAIFELTLRADLQPHGRLNSLCLECGVSANLQEAPSNRKLPKITT